ASLWHRAHVAITASPAGLPRKAIADSRPDASCALVLSATVGLPPWQSMHRNPLSRCTSCREDSVTGVDRRVSCSVAWHPTQVFGSAATGCAGAAPVGIAMVTRTKRVQRTQTHAPPLCPLYCTSQPLCP